MIIVASTDVFSKESFMNSKAEKAGKCAINLTITVMLNEDLKFKDGEGICSLGLLHATSRHIRYAKQIFDFHKTSFAIGSARKIRNGGVYILKRL